MSRTQHDLLDPPGGDFRHEQLVRVAAVDLVHRAELAELLAGLAELADDRAVELHLVDLAGDVAILRQPVVGNRVRDEQILMRARRDADRPRVADVVVDRLDVQVVVEDLDARVAAIADVDVSLRIHRHRVRQVELPGLVAARARLLDEPAVLVELHDARVAVAVGDEDVAGRVPADVGRPAEHIVLRRRRRRCRQPARRCPSTASGRRPSTITTRPSGLNLMTMFVPSSTAQMLSSRSTRTACANSNP